MVECTDKFTVMCLYSNYKAVCLEIRTMLSMNLLHYFEYSNHLFFLFSIEIH